MGKKSWKKRERRIARMRADPMVMLNEMLKSHRQGSDNRDQVNPFQEHLAATRRVLRKYERLDAAIALGASELWPANTGSPITWITTELITPSNYV